MVTSAAEAKRMDAAISSHPCKVTPRQREVLGLVARGYTNARIGLELGISLDGAKWHVGEAIAALGLSSRTEAAQWWRATHTSKPHEVPLSQAWEGVRGEGLVRHASR